MKTTTAKLAAACIQVQTSIAKLQALTGDIGQATDSTVDLTYWLMDTIEYYAGQGKPGPVEVTVKGDQIDFTMPAKGLPTDDDEVAELFHTSTELVDIRGKTVTVSTYMGNQYQ